MSSKLRIPFEGKDGGPLLRVNGGLLRLVDLVEVILVYQRVGCLSSYDQVFLAPVNIFICILS